MIVHDTTIVQALRSSGLRVTAPRHAVLGWLNSHPHATAQQVHAGVTEQIGAISKQAVYDVLSACLAADLIQRIKPAGHPARYERRTGDNHHHLVCRACGRIQDTDCDVGHAPCLRSEPDHDFVVDEAEIVFWGLCEHCRDPSVSDPAAAGGSASSHTEPGAPDNSPIGG